MAETVAESAHTAKGALTACRAERDNALADAEKLRARVDELKSSLDFVSTFERWEAPRAPGLFPTPSSAHCTGHRVRSYLPPNCAFPQDHDVAAGCWHLISRCYWH